MKTTSGCLCDHEIRTMAANRDSTESGVGNCTKESFLVGKLGAPCFFVVLVLVTRSHNHRTFPREYAEWDRSILCQRCGAVFTQPT